MNTATLDREEQAQVDAIRARKAKERQHQEQIDRLQKQVDEARDRLSRAEDFKSFAAQRITQLQQALLQLWGKERVVTNVDPTIQAIDCYNTISTLRSAIDDYPRIKRHLETELSTATQKLAQFNQQK